jgi:hypothetical protein
LSIVVCLLFTWLSVFIIVGHCSDAADAAAAASGHALIQQLSALLDLRYGRAFENEGAELRQRP